ncbi:hypothetical protein BS17DRAFT_51543 [Gyrodon lividus]|nr:hypothetical protein BS17DRAFT_51543 [Gyrodon lividus]
MERCKAYITTRREFGEYWNDHWEQTYGLHIHTNGLPTYSVAVRAADMMKRASRIWFDSGLSTESSGPKSFQVPAAMTTSQSYPLADLHDLCSRLVQVHHSIQSYDAVSPYWQLPVIDVSPSSSHNSKGVHEKEKKTATHREGLPGLRFLREEVERDCKVLEKFLQEHSNSSSVRPLSTNAPYLIAVWDELAHARRPVAIYRFFSPQVTTDTKDGKRGGKATPAEARKAQIRAVKVDVVAENGTRWVRVNTIKNSRIMMEFRELDSYLTSDDDSEGGDEWPRLAQTGFDNSVLRMGRELLAAAKANPISVPAPFSGTISIPKLNTGPHPETCSSSAIIPEVTIRLTRLDPSLNDDIGAKPDPRIEQTIRCLREMGVDVQLGERPHLHSASSSEKRVETKMLEPTRNVNLDLSALIALISDITHSPLASTEEDAYARFVLPQRYLKWKKDRVELLTCQSQATSSHSLDGSTNTDDGVGGNEGTREDSGQHSRALAAQAIREMEMGILDEMHERLSAIIDSPKDSSSPSTSSLRPSPLRALTGVQFWATKEARQRCLQIVSKIGGRRERHRADALFGSDICPRIPPVPAPTPAPRKSLTDAGGTPTDTDTTSTYGNPQMQRYDGESPCSMEPEDTYWEHSRYPTRFLPLVPIHIFPSTLPSPDEVANQGHVPEATPRTPFFEALALTCTGILSLGVAPVPALTPVSQIPSLPPFSPPTEEGLEEIPPATRTFLAKLTTHTVSSMLAGSSRGYTTLTTNKSSVKVVMKEMRRVFGRGGYGSGVWGKEEVVDKEKESGDGGRTVPEKAALWIVDPRSLAEDMRSDINFGISTPLD